MAKGTALCFISAESDLTPKRVWASLHLTLAVPPKHSSIDNLPWPSVPNCSLNLFVDMFRAKNTGVGFHSVSQIHSRKAYFIIKIQTGTGPPTCLHVVQNASQFFFKPLYYIFLLFGLFLICWFYPGWTLSCYLNYLGIFYPTVKESAFPLLSLGMREPHF